MPALFVCIALWTFLASATAFAQNDEARLGLGVRSPVVAGEASPALTLAPTVAVKSLAVSIKRKSDGRTFMFNEKKLAAGDSRALEFDQEPGVEAYEAQFTVEWGAGGAPSKFAIAFEAEAVAGLSIDIAQRDVDLDARRLRFSASRPVAEATVVAFGDGGEELGRGTAQFAGSRGKQLELKWEQKPATIRKLEVKVTDTSGFWSTMEVNAFYVDPWEDRIYFATGSDVIESSEKPKLEATLARIRAAIDTAQSQYGSTIDLRLYVAGYTDTVGTNASNFELSNRRARSIARFFREKGLTITTYFQGFGEEVLAVQTPDNTPEERNRRTLYVLSSQTPTSGAFPRSDWKKL
jgi:outer membrane protein OmpA-like peptidoglycan-associated protein